MTGFSPFLTCAGDNYIEPFDPRCRRWYEGARSNNNSRKIQSLLDIKIRKLIYYIVEI